MAHTKAGGSTKLGRESAAQRLGVKLHDGEKVTPGQIIVRQRGSHYLAGKNVNVGSDDTLFAAKAGVVKFTTKKKVCFDRSIRYAKTVSVISK
ncbi:MAG: 50S ribosomal protein L27 [Patescibacteria group bacterium]|nr:50S ribosomal protein L27 [Patescibacteria group bacterium]MCL5224282.1 50S ribosomal protein L27 [Patescibacteria group bacterium]